VNISVLHPSDTETVARAMSGVYSFELLTAETLCDLVLGDDLLSFGGRENEFQNHVGKPCPVISCLATPGLAVLFCCLLQDK